jgi:ribosome-binding factor A
MTTRRTAKVAAAIRQVVSTAILMELRDPRVKGVTVLNVEVPTDLRTAKVYITVLGDEKSARLSLKGLEAARGWIQSRIADELQLRLTPILSFVIDPGVKKSIEVSRLLREIQPPVDDTDNDEAGDEAETDDTEDDADGEEE